MGIIGNYSKLFYLERPEHKVKLIEILLIIGALIYVKLPDNIDILFIPFVALSIPYLIIIQKNEEEIHFNKILLFLPFLISVTFSGVLAVSFTIIAIKEFLGVTYGILDIVIKLILILLILVIPYILFSFILFSALRIKS